MIIIPVSAEVENIAFLPARSNIRWLIERCRTNPLIELGHDEGTDAVSQRELEGCQRHPLLEQLDSDSSSAQPTVLRAFVSATNVSTLSLGPREAYSIAKRITPPRGDGYPSAGCGESTKTQVSFPA